MMNDRGSITIIALLLAIIFGFITTSFLNSTLTELKIAKSNSNSKKVVNVTHSGAEIAIRAVNENDFTGWTPSGPWLIKSLYNLDMGDGDTATMYLYVLDQAPRPSREVPVQKPLVQLVSPTSQPTKVIPSIGE